jgi:nondiscriminating aspartyl-tRNA synthetase
MRATTCDTKHKYVEAGWHRHCMVPAFEITNAKEFMMEKSARALIHSLNPESNDPVRISGWIYRLRQLARTTFVVLKDCTGAVQCTTDTSLLKPLSLKLEMPIEITGYIKREPRAPNGLELEIKDLLVLNDVSLTLPFNSSSNISDVGLDTILTYRPLSLRNESVGDIFKIQALILQYLRQFLQKHHFTEIITSKIVASGTEGGTNLFAIKYFERSAYLAQSPQFYKEHSVAGLERVFETGHVYRAEPHASSRHLTEYYSLDLEMGFINGPEEIIQLERELLNFIFDQINQNYSSLLKRYGRESLPNMLQVPIWDFEDCLKKLQDNFDRNDLIDDLDPLAERQLCEIAAKETGVSAVFVIGFPLSGRPFYTHPRGGKGAAQSFDLLFEGLEITTGGQRLHRRADLENALISRSINPKTFEDHLRMFEIGMPPHGGLAIGLERLTAQILNLGNVRQATLYPRDRYRISP